MAFAIYASGVMSSPAVCKSALSCAFLYSFNLIFPESHTEKSLTHISMILVFFSPMRRPRLLVSFAVLYEGT